MNKKYILVANWKLNKSYLESVAWCKDQTQLQQLTRSGQTIILCPSFDALAPIAPLIQDTQLFLGAQNCASSIKGAYTGEVSVQSLQEIGCSYCIIGHSERKKYFGEDDIAILKKAKLLLEYNITPIWCIGEQEPLALENFQDTIKRLLTPLYSLPQINHKKIIIAYEPVWAIGSGKMPSLKLLEEIITFIQQEIVLKLPNYKISLLYGGSVDQSNIKQILSIPSISGTLLGSASLDFQNFKNIVCSI